LTQLDIQRQRLNSLRSNTLANVSLLLLFTAISAFAQEPRNADTELDNVRALPFGFHAQCEDGDLKIRKKGSATFVVRNSLSCSRIRLQIAERYQNDFTLCSNDPTHVSSPPDRKVVRCVELKIDDVAI